jgi:hypothetical protein
VKVHGVCKEDAVEKKKGKKKKAIQICVRVYEPKAQSLLPNDNIASPIILNSYLFLDDGREQRGFSYNHPRCFGMQSHELRRISELMGRAINQSGKNNTIEG